MRGPYLRGLVPLALLLWDTYHKNVGANPLEFVTRTTGMLTLVFLFLTLAVTPARKITRLNWLVKFRRMLGLFAFFYVSLHLLTYIWFDRFFNFRSIALIRPAGTDSKTLFVDSNLIPRRDGSVGVSDSKLCEVCCSRVKSSDV